MKPTTRRAFVQVAGLGAAGFLARRAGAVSIIGGKVGSMTVGLMLATDGSYARMADSFTDGFRMAMDEQKVSLSLTTRPVSRGYDSAYKTASDLIANNADVVVADVTAPVAKLLTPLFEQAKVPLVVANVGGHVPLPADKSAYVVHNSLLYWQASYALGRWAAENIGKKGYIAASLADAGYDAVYAFRRAFEATGGSVADTDVTHIDPRSPGLSDLFRAIGATSPSFVYAQYTGPVGADFVKAYSSSGLTVPLLGGGLLVDDYLLGSIGNAAKGVKTASSWTPSNPATANKTFRDSYSARTGRNADPFAVLGYDTANLLVTGFQNTSRLGLAPGRLVDALAGASIVGPRGKLTVDGSTNTVVGPVSVREVQGALGQYQNVIVGATPLVAAFPAKLSPLQNGTSNAYYNEVLCA